LSLPLGIPLFFHSLLSLNLGQLFTMIIAAVDLDLPPGDFLQWGHNFVPSSSS
jgi:hypothetical protein